MIMTLAENENKNMKNQGVSLLKSLNQLLNINFNLITDYNRTLMI